MWTIQSAVVDTQFIASLEKKVNVWPESQVQGYKVQLNQTATRDLELAARDQLLQDGPQIITVLIN